jgi:hypothetical protein
VNHEIAIKIKRKGLEEKITLGWFASLMGGCSPRMVFSPCPSWLWGFFLEEDERKWNDGSVYEWICRAPESYLLAAEMHREWWLACVHWWEYQMTGVFCGCEGVFQWNSVHGSLMRILCGFYAKGQEFVRIRLEESSRMRSKQWRFICTN